MPCRGGCGSQAAAEGQFVGFVPVLLPAKRPPPAQGRKYFPRRGKKNRHLPAAALPEQFFPCFSPQGEVLCFGEIWFRIFFIFFFGRCWEFGTRTLGLGAAAAIANSCCSLLLPSWERFGRESDPDFRQFIENIYRNIASYRGREAAQRPSRSWRLRFPRASLGNEPRRGRDSSGGIFLGCRKRGEAPWEGGGSLGTASRVPRQPRSAPVRFVVHSPAAFPVPLPPFRYSTSLLG